MSKIQIKLTRDSVCAGDDMENHTKIVSITPSSGTNDTIMGIAQEYLPLVAGYGHTWDCFINDEKIAVIRGNCKELIPTVAVASFSDGSCLFFRYHSATY